MISQGARKILQLSFSVVCLFGEDLLDVEGVFMFFSI